MDGLNKYKEIATFAVSVLTVSTAAAALVGGWGLLNYCSENGIPFPAELPTFIIIIGIVGSWYAFVAIGIIFLPSLGKIGFFGEEYTWLLSKNKHGDKSFLGYIGVPVLLFQISFLLHVAVKVDHAQYVYTWLLAILALFSFGITTFCGFKEGERIKAITTGRDCKLNCVTGHASVP